jgi:hypothetical protein
VVERALGVLSVMAHEMAHIVWYSENVPNTRRNGCFRRDIMRTWKKRSLSNPREPEPTEPDRWTAFAEWRNNYEFREQQDRPRHPGLWNVDPVPKHPNGRPFTPNEEVRALYRYYVSPFASISPSAISGNLNELRVEFSDKVNILVLATIGNPRNTTLGPKLTCGGP